MPSFLQGVVKDAAYAARTFRKSPLFVAVAVLSLALGIGANTAIFTLVNQLILQPLPVSHPEQLVLLTARGRHYGSNNGPNALSYGMYQDFRDHNQVFQGMFSRHGEMLNVASDGKSELVSGEMVSGNYFSVLGVGAALGRVISLSDDLVQGANPVAVLSYSYWQTRFGGDSSVFGKRVVVNGVPLTIVGVSQKGFDGVEPGYSPKIRVPMTMQDSLPPGGPYPQLNDRRRRFIQVFGRLTPGVTMEQAKAGLQPLFHQILQREVQESAFAKASPEIKAQFLSMSMDLLPGSKGRSQLREQFAKPLLALMTIVALVLLIACSNLANLLIARASSRQKEIAVRLAMGAGRWRIMRQLLVESLLLAFLGGAAGLLLAGTIDRMLIRFQQSDVQAIALSADPDASVLLFTLVISIVTGLIFGLVPALQATRPELASTLKDQAGAVAGGASANLRKGLVVAQVALSLLLLVGAGLFLRSLNNLQQTNPGFEIKNLVSFVVEPTLARYDKEWTRGYYRQLLERLNGLPGAESAALAVMPLLDGNEWDNGTTVEGYTAKTGKTADPHMQFTSPGFFATLKIPMLAGRDFTAKDDAASGKVGIVNAKFAKLYFGDSSPLGRHLGFGIDPGTKMDIEIIGVVGDTKYESMRDDVPDELYVPYAQQPWVSGMVAYVRTHNSPVGMFNPLVRAVHEVDASVPMFDMRTLDAQVEKSLVTERLLAGLSSVFGGLATLLAALGLYGVMAFMVARRTREIGLRMALGASGGSVVWLVMREVLLLAVIGLVAGLAAAYALTRLVEAQLFGIKSTDPGTMALAAVGIVAVAAIAGFLPARRATTIDPMNALRFE